MYLSSVEPLCCVCCLLTRALKKQPGHPSQTRNSTCACSATVKMTARAHTQGRQHCLAFSLARWTASAAACRMSHVDAPKENATRTTCKTIYSVDTKFYSKPWTAIEVQEDFPRSPRESVSSTICCYISCECFQLPRLKLPHPEGWTLAKNISSQEASVKKSKADVQAQPTWAIFSLVCLTTVDTKNPALP